MLNCISFQLRFDHFENVFLFKLPKDGDARLQRQWITAMKNIIEQNRPKAGAPGPYPYLGFSFFFKYCMLRTINVYACYAVKIEEIKPRNLLGGGWRGIGRGGELVHRPPIRFTYIQLLDYVPYKHKYNEVIKYPWYAIKFIKTWSFLIKIM